MVNFSMHRNKRIALWYAKKMRNKGFKVVIKKVKGVNKLRYKNYYYK